MGEFGEVFSRSILFWGEEKQQRLADACILSAGVGGLGCTVSQVLARAGVGKLVLVDCGVIDEPDLNRQILYTLDDLGKPKVEVAAERLAAIHKQTEVIPLNIKIEDTSEFFDTLRQYQFDGIADCLDNFSSRFVLEKLVTEDIFLVHGGVQSDYGQLTTIKPPQTRTLKELYPNVEDADSPLPVGPQIVVSVATMLAHEVINNLWRTPRLLNTLLIVELSDFTFSKIKLNR